MILENQNGKALVVAGTRILHWDWDAWLGKKIDHGRHSRLHWDMDMHAAGEIFVKLLGGRFVNNAPCTLKCQALTNFHIAPKRPQQLKD